MILVVNTGSSSVRLAEFDGSTPLRRERLERGPGQDPVPLLRAFGGHPDRVVHRIVHGGGELDAPTEVTPEVEKELEALVPLAPLHQPVALEWLRAARTVHPQARQIAVFDTAFFSRLPDVARHYAIPPELGMRRHGFHGLAHQAMWRRLGLSAGRAITLQLGSGCSAAAIRDGQPLDTSMGRTPLEGLVMATRPGDLDPGIHLDEELLNHGAGLYGLSGESGDVRALLASGSPRARLALALYSYRIKKYVGAYLAVLGGVDALVFSGGVGEHQPPIRAAALAGLEPFGIAIDSTKNLANQPRIEAGAVAIHVMASDEEQQMIDTVNDRR